MVYLIVFRERETRYPKGFCGGNYSLQAWCSHCSLGEAVYPAHQQRVSETMPPSPTPTLHQCAWVWLLCFHRLHYLPAEGRPNEFNDRTYQSQLPLYARSTTARVGTIWWEKVWDIIPFSFQSIKTNLAATELKIEQDRILASQKVQTEEILMCLSTFFLCVCRLELS